MHDSEPLFRPRPVWNRRQLLRGTAAGIGGAALASLLGREAKAVPGSDGGVHHAPRARRMIYLHQSGAPSQLDLFDPKPELTRRHGEELPESIRQGQRLTGMTSGQASFPMAAPRFTFRQHGESGAWLSELLPNIAGVADRLCFVRSMHTEAINHDPAITFVQTGFQQAGRPCLGSWLSYGLGSMNDDLPTFVVLISQGSSKRDSQPLFARLWGNGFLPSDHQGVQLRAGKDPVLYLGDPPGVDRAARRRMLDALSDLNRERAEAVGDPEIDARMSQYELAYRMQASVPELCDLDDEPEEVFELYGQDARQPGTYAANCLLARRLIERDVRFVQLYHRGWDQHENLPTEIALQAGDTDRASAALIADLERLGLLEDTLVVWGGEFGRTVYCQGELTETNYGRDHHPRCFTIWLAGGGVRGGLTYGSTDEVSYNITEDPVSVFDLNATLLHLLGIDHERLTYRHQGREFRLTDVEGHVIQGLLA